MRRYETKEIRKEINEVTYIICNKCGKQIKKEGGVWKSEVLSIQKRWGYFSEKDNEVHSFDLCEECYDNLIRSFLIPPTIENQ